jgi:hypothetical protein
MPGLRLYLSTFFLLCLLCTSLSTSAQEAIRPRPSPLAVANVRYKTTYLKVVYSQPHKKGRTIFGALVPFGKVWRTGANEATELTATKDIQVNGTLLPAGTYSLFTIPETDHWTIIINSEVGLWGSYNYNESLDVMRFDVPVEQIPGDLVWEPFTIQIDHKNEVADLLLVWDKTRVRIPVRLIF